MRPNPGQDSAFEQRPQLRVAAAQAWLPAVPPDAALRHIKDGVSAA